MTVYFLIESRLVCGFGYNLHRFRSQENFHKGKGWGERFYEFGSQIFDLLPTSNLAGTFTGSIRTKANKSLEKRERGIWVFHIKVARAVRIMDN